MGSTFFSLHYHIVFSTKERRPFIKNTWQPDLHSYLGGIINGMKGVAETVGGVEDHVHLLASLRPVHCIADVIRDLKKDSSTWIKEKFDRRFSWQEGYPLSRSARPQPMPYGVTLPTRKSIIA